MVLGRERGVCVGGGAPGHVGGPTDALNDEPDEGDDEQPEGDDLRSGPGGQLPGPEEGMVF